MNIPSQENTVKALLADYIKRKKQYDNLKKQLDDLKEQIDQQIQEDRYDYEGVASFKRKADFVRRTLDQSKLSQNVPYEILDKCYKETKVKGSIEIVSWETKELRKQMYEEKNEQK